MIMFHQYSSHDICVDFDAKRIANNECNARATKVRIALFNFDNGFDQFIIRAFRPRLSSPGRREEL